MVPYDQHKQEAPQEDILTLVHRLAETEAALAAAIGGQVDAIIDPARATPILLSTAQAALQESEARHRRLLARMAALVFELAVDGTIRFVNQAVTHVTGYAPEELIGYNWWEVLFTSDQRWQQAWLTARFAEGDVTNVELAITRKDGAAVSLELNSANRYDHVGRLEVIVGLAIDITERKQLELMRRQHAEAQEAIRVRDEFLSIAAHELKTPLTSLLAYAQLVQRRTQREGTLSQKDRETLQLVISQTDRLNRMVFSMLDVSRMQHGQLSIEPQHMDLCSLIQRLSEEVTLTLEHHTLELHRPTPPLYIVGDAFRLEQVFLNLIQNAIKYSPTGGLILIDVRAEQNHVCVSITDQGLGIPADAQVQLFQRFYRATHVASVSIPGLGIGLYVVKAIVDAHGGTVTVQSTEGVGSTFTVCLPTEI